MIDGAPVPMRVHTVVVSTQHNEDVSQDTVREGLMEHVVKFVIPEQVRPTPRRRSVRIHVHRTCPMLGYRHRQPFLGLV